MTTPNDIYRDAIIGLLNHREFLGYQLSHAHGYMTDEELSKISDEYFAGRKVWPQVELVLRAKVLAELLDGELDSDVFSTMFNIDLCESSEAMLVAAKEMRDEQAGDCTSSTR